MLFWLGRLQIRRVAAVAVLVIENIAPGNTMGSLVVGVARGKGKLDFLAET